MMTSVFDRSALPPAEVFYRQELGTLCRPDRKGWARPKSGCPFHNSKSKKSFFVNLVHGGFCCLSPNCAIKGGDVLAYVRLRYKLTFAEGKKYLGIGSLTPEKKRELDQVSQEQARAQEEELARKKREHDARDYLHALERLYSHFQGEHDIDVLADLLPCIRSAEAEYWQLSGFEVQHEC